MPTMRSLKRLLPYYHPYRRDVAWGLALVVASSAIGAVPPWLLRSAVDGMRGDAPLGRILQLAGGIIGLAVVAGAMRFWMRELLNGLSRRIDHPPRHDPLAPLTHLAAPFY